MSSHKISEEKRQQNAIKSDLLWWCINQDLFDTNDESISTDVISHSQSKICNFALEKTNNDPEKSKKFISFAMKEFPLTLFELVQHGASKNLNAIWYQYEISEKISEKTKNIEKPDVEAKMESGQGTSSFSNKKHSLSEITDLNSADIKVSKQESFRKVWNEVNDTTASLEESGDKLGTAKLKKAQAIMTGAVDTAQSGANLLGTTMTTALNAPQLVMDLTNMVISETTSYITSATMDLARGALTYTLKFPARIVSMTASYYKDYLSYFKLTLDDVMISDESKVEIQNEINKSLEQKKIMDLKTERVQKSTEKINNVISKVTTGMNTISEHIQEGPEWVETQCNKILFNGLSYVGQARDDALEWLHDTLQEKADKIAYNAAWNDFKKFTDKTEKIYKDEFEKIQVMQMKVKIKASQVIAVAKSKIIAKLGL